MRRLLPLLGILAAFAFLTAQVGGPGGVQQGGGPILLGDGSATNPSYAFQGSTGTGMYRAASARLRFATGGSARWEIDGNGNINPQSAGLAIFTSTPIGPTAAGPVNMAFGNVSTLFTNTGAAGSITWNLIDNPTTGQCWSWAVLVAQPIVIAPAAGESIRDGASTGSTQITSTTVGDTISICSVTAGSGALWLVINKKGTWTLS